MRARGGGGGGAVQSRMNTCLGRGVTKAAARPWLKVLRGSARPLFGRSLLYYCGRDWRWCFVSDPFRVPSIAPLLPETLLGEWRFLLRSRVERTARTKHEPRAGCCAVNYPPPPRQEEKGQDSGLCVCGQGGSGSTGVVVFFCAEMDRMCWVRP